MVTGIRCAMDGLLAWACESRARRCFDHSPLPRPGTRTISRLLLAAAHCLGPQPRFPSSCVCMRLRELGGVHRHLRVDVHDAVVIAL